MGGPEQQIQDAYPGQQEENQETQEQQKTPEELNLTDIQSIINELQNLMGKNENQIHFKEKNGTGTQIELKSINEDITSGIIKLQNWDLSSGEGNLKKLKEFTLKFNKTKMNIKPEIVKIFLGKVRENILEYKESTKKNNKQNEKEETEKDLAEAKKLIAYLDF